ncbi:MAG: hypothetical protein ABFD44_08805, partial [Anaerolineaceae bacterium]
MIPPDDDPFEPAYKQDLSISPARVNAAGMLGYFPNPHNGITLDGLGAFITAPISLLPRQPAAERALIPFPGGFLMHSGLANPGFRHALKLYASHWAHASLPVIVHLLVDHPENTAYMVERLSVCEGVVGVEMGLPPAVTAAEAAAQVRAAAGELPVIACLPMENAALLAPAAKNAGASAVSLAAPRGSLPSGKHLVTGRLYGPAVLPFTLAALRGLEHLGLPVWAGGGVYRDEDA